ncbi:hypothetical protein GUJ93_ZPchr0009g1113 [Zizania palustris]|uniref:Uncharacterized protein n=1 Tax=Zizania palustris TaxID=103762 RepID=A0A8J5S3J8_ZIZPA|nr:hypothetical protein GUJ93_ZPchr0009g1113 [Zizania palustris]
MRTKVAQVSGLMSKHNGAYYKEIYIVDSLDREGIVKVKAEFQVIVNDPLMLNNIILVFANKQDMALLF